jgi:hypothetical protein
MNKEELKAKRKEAYQKAKEKRDLDPKYIALKEKARQERKAQYQEYKNKLKQEKEAERQKQKDLRDEEIAKEAGLFEKLKLLKWD